LVDDLGERSEEIGRVDFGVEEDFGSEETFVSYIEGVFLSYLGDYQFDSGDRGESE